MQREVPQFVDDLVLLVPFVPLIPFIFSSRLVALP